MELPRTPSLAFKVVAVAVAAIAAAAAYAWWEFRRERDEALERAYVQAELVALSLEEHANHSFDMAAGLLEILDEMVRERGGAAGIRPAMRQALARELYGVENAYQALAVLAPSGEVLATSGSPAAPIPAETRGAITRRFREDPQYSGIDFSRAFPGIEGNEYVVSFAKGYHEADGRLSAVLVATVRMSHFQRAYERIREASGASEALSLFSLDAYLLARSPLPIVGTLNTTLPGSQENLDRGLAAAKGRLRIVAPRDNEERIAVLRRVGEYPFVVAVSTKVDDVLAPILLHARQQGAAVVGASLLLLAFVALVARQAQELTHSQRLMRLATQGAGVGVWDRDLRTGTHRPPEVLALAGLTTQDPGVTDPLLLNHLAHPDDRARIDAFLEQVVASRGEPFTLEYRMRVADGSYHWFQSTARVVAFEGGRPARIAGTLVDVDQRRRAEDAVRELAADLERKVEERTRELELVVRELESFSYSVSHDLRAPVRHVGAFAKLARDALEGGDLAAAKHHLGRVLDAGEHMDHVIQHLLKLARVGRTQPQAVRVDLTAIAKDVMRRVREAEPGRTAQVTIDSGLVALGDPGLTEVALENLLSNAWKFTRPRGPEARIEVGLASDRGAPAFYVRDNGVGFDAGRAERLFQPFTRLHSVSEFEGTGIGLATVKRALERQGGTVRAESTPGEGTTIYFTLPAGGVR